MASRLASGVSAVPTLALITETKASGSEPTRKLKLFGWVSEAAADAPHKTTIASIFTENMLLLETVAVSLKHVRVLLDFVGSSMSDDASSKMTSKLLTVRFFVHTDDKSCDYWIGILKKLEEFNLASRKVEGDLMLAEVRSLILRMRFNEADYSSLVGFLTEKKDEVPSSSRSVFPHKRVLVMFRGQREGPYKDARSFEYFPDSKCIEMHVDGLRAEETNSFLQHFKPNTTLQKCEYIGRHLRVAVLASPDIQLVQQWKERWKNGDPSDMEIFRSGDLAEATINNWITAMFVKGRVSFLHDSQREDQVSKSDISERVHAMASGSGNSQLKSDNA